MLFKSFERILFLGEHIDRSVIEIEPQDVNFLEQEFPRKVEVSRDSDFYELDKSEPSCPVKQEEHHPCEWCSAPAQESHMLRRSNRDPRHRFEI